MSNPYFTDERTIANALATSSHARCVLVLDMYETANLVRALAETKGAVNNGDWYEQIRWKIAVGLRELYGYGIHPEPNFAMVRDILGNTKSNWPKPLGGNQDD